MLSENGIVDRMTQVIPIMLGGEYSREKLFLPLLSPWNIPEILDELCPTQNILKMCWS